MHHQKMMCMSSAVVKHSVPPAITRSLQLIPKLLKPLISPGAGMSRT